MGILPFKELLFTIGEEQGFTEMELYYEREKRFGCEWFEGAIDSYETSDVFGVSFRGKYNGKVGTAFTEKLDEQSILFLLKEAKENSQYIEDESEEIFAGSAQYEEISFYSDSLNKVTPHEKIDLLKEIEQEIFKLDERVTGTDSLYLNSIESERALINSKGLARQEKQNFVDISVSVVVKHGDEIKTGAFSASTKDFASLNAEKIARKAVEEALSQLGSSRIESKSYQVLLHHDAAAHLLNTFSPIFSAEQIQKGQSLLKDKIGQMIAAANINIVDDPTLKDGLFSRTFDHEGVATKRQYLVSKGKLVSILHNQNTAKKDGCQSSGHAYRSSYKDSLTVAPTNLFIEQADKSYEELLAEMTEGIVIIELDGLHSGADPVSGNFSVAANGFYVKDGKINMPLNLMTIAGNFFELIQQIEEVGSDLAFVLSFVAPGYIGSPSLLIEELAVTIE